MSELIQVRKKAQLTLPLSVRKKLDIEEGDFLDVMVKDGTITLRLKKMIDKNQEWFWTRRWQSGEKEAEQDIIDGQVHSFEKFDDAVKFLHQKAVPKKSKQVIK